MSDMIQNGYTKLTRRLFALSLKRALILCGLLFGVTMLLMLKSVNDVTFVQAYESLITRAGIRYVFLAALGVWMLSEAAAIHADNFRNNGIYTMMMLPTPRRNVFLAYCTRGVVCVLMLWTVATLALLVSYAPVVALCKNAATAFQQIDGQLYAVERHNGLFLAIIRGDLFHILLPQSVPEAAGSLLVILVCGCLPAYTLVCRRASLAQSVFLVGSFACVFWALTCRFNCVTFELDISTFVVSTSLLALSMAGIVVDSVRRLNKDANLV